MRKLVLPTLLFTSLLLPILVSADTTVSGVISTDTTWSPDPDGGAYIIDSSFSVSSGVTLTIEPGTIIKARATGMGGPSIYGSLLAQGTSELPIYFTSYWDDSIGGDTDGGGPSISIPGEWQGLYFKDGSLGELDHVVVRYSGYGGFGFGNFVGVENDGGTLDIKHSNIHDNYRIISNGAGGVMSAGTGVYNRRGTLSVSDTTIENNVFGIRVESGTTTISNTIFKNNKDSTGHSAGYGLYAFGPELLTLLNNTFIGNWSTASVEISKQFIHSGNTSSDLNNRGFIMTGNARDGMVLESTDLPILVLGSITVEAGKTMTIAPGTILKFGSYPSFGSIVVHGTLIARGTAEDKIYFTSIRDDSIGEDTNGDGEVTLPLARDWNAIFLESGSSAVFEHSEVKYSGYNFNGEYLPGVAAAIYNRGSDLSVTNSFLGHNFGASIFQDAGTTNISHSELTDSAYGLQFRAGEATISQSSLHGHNDQAVYNQSGYITQFPDVVVLDARNNWWGSADGPHDISTSTPTGTGDRVSINVFYTPWLGSDPLIAPPRNPVIIVPGIMGSVMIDSDLVANNEIWPAPFKLLTDVFDIHLDKLILDSFGNNFVQDNVSQTEIVKSAGDSDYFESLFNQITSLGYQEDNDLFEDPYDWRLDISKTASDTELNNDVFSLKEKIDGIKSKTGAEKVDIVAHSMGGLLVKKYLRDYGGNSVGKFVDIATPHTGAPKSFKILNYGDNFDIKFLGVNILSSSEIKKISQNMPAVYQLLPSRNYFDDSDNNYKYYVFNALSGGIGKLTFDQTGNYLKDSGRNSLLVDRADAFHQEIDNLNPAVFGVETYNIVGCGTPTIGQFYILDNTNGHNIYNIKMINGDGTVPLKSAESIPALKTYYAKNAVHATIPSLTGVKELVADILTATSTDVIDISAYPNLATSAAGCTIPNGRIVSFHSPIELHIYSGNNHTGPNIDGDIENNIPGVSYEVIDGNKFAFLPDGVEYIVKGIATDDGTFDARIETIENENVVETRYFNQVPIASTTQVELTNDSVLIDNNSDNIFESGFTVSSVLDENQSSDLTKPVTSITVTGKKKIGEPYLTPVKVTLSAIDGNSGILKTEYSLDDGQTWVTYIGAFTIGTKGDNKLLYKSTDRAGNVEIPKTEIINILYPGNSGNKK